MSSTRSPSPRAPATEPLDPGADILLLLGHGASRSATAARTLERHAAVLRGMGRFAQVRVAMLRGAPALERVIEELDGGARLLVLPVLMSAGVLAGTELPRRLQAALGQRPGPTLLLPVLGSGEAFADFVALRAAALARDNGLDPGSAALLLVAHGNSRDDRGRASVEALAAAVAASTVFTEVRTAFLEGPPAIADSLRTIVGPVVSVGLFAAPGRHASEDLPRHLVAASGGRAVPCLAALGGDDGLPPVLLAHTLASLSAAGSAAAGLLVPRPRQSSSARDCAAC